MNKTLLYSLAAAGAFFAAAAEAGVKNGGFYGQTNERRNLCRPARKNQTNGRQGKVSV